MNIELVLEVEQGMLWGEELIPPKKFKRKVIVSEENNLTFKEIIDGQGLNYFLKYRGLREEKADWHYLGECCYEKEPGKKTPVRAKIISRKIMS